MTTPEPARKIDVLFERLIEINAAFYDETGQPVRVIVDEIELKRLERDARNSLGTDTRKARMALGLIAAFRGDETGADREFAAARVLGWTPVTAMNYAATLRRFCRIDDALTHAMTVVDQGPGPLYAQALNQAVEWAYTVGRLHLASTLLAKLREHAKGAITERLTTLAEALRSLVKAADELGLTDDLMAATQAPVWAAIRELPLADFAAVALQDEVIPGERPSILRTYWVDISEEEGFALNGRMNEIWAESDDASPVDDFCPLIVGRGAG